MLSEITDKYLEQASKLISQNKEKFYFIEEGDEMITELPNDKVPIENSWNFMERISLDKDKNVLGYFQVYVKRPENYAENILIINFGEPNRTFSKDYFDFWTSLFEVHKLRKLKFFVIIGNPAEKQYDKLVKKYDGRIVGILKEEVLYRDGTYKDIKIYELYKENYDKVTKNKKTRV